jgi:hypothetical protein
MNRLTQSKNTTILPVLIALTLGCFALSPVARAVCREGCDNSDTFLGEGALSNKTPTGGSNTAIGREALFKNTGFLNTAIGEGALFDNNTGDNNTATGCGALRANQGDNNTADGQAALNENIMGHDNTATGFHALLRNRGDNNTATGAGALEGTIGGITGSNNTAIGTVTLFTNKTGFDNTATGFDALYANTEGSSNTANGVNALSANTTGNNNIAIGRSAGMNLTTGSNNIDIGHHGTGADANTIRIGTQGTQKRTFIAGISGTAVRSGVQVFVNAKGQLGTVPSSGRFKQDIKPMDKASEAILALKPVTPSATSKSLTPMASRSLGWWLRT